MGGGQINLALDAVEEGSPKAESKLDSCLRLRCV